jgi:hypothetical protein
MPSLRIPNSVRPGFKVLVRLDATAASALSTALRQAGAPSDPDEIAAKIAADVPSISPADADEVVDTLLSLYGLRASMELSVSELVADIADALDATNDPDLALGEERRVLFIDLLARLLEVQALETRIKEAEIHWAYDRVFVGARILTDIRPVFGVDVSAPPSEALIIHNLQISYHENDEHKEFYVALDARDLEVLANVLDRARRKTRSLKAVLDAANVPYPEEE